MKTLTTLDYKAIAKGASEWLKEYANRAGIKGFVLGVSGGIDSAVVSTLCARTGLSVLILELPIHQSQGEVDRAKNHIKWLKANYPNVESKEIDLTDTYDIFYEDCSMGESVFGIQISQESFDFSMANTRSRLRMTTLYQYAGMYRLLVAGTGNKVEDFGIGFYTKYGDGGVDISPIADLMKSEVYALGAALGIHEDILTAAPTDGLHTDGRTDEEQLKCTYAELEWAMIWVESHTAPPGDNVWISIYNNSEDHALTNRQKEVLEIYKNRHASNLHKMTSIPVYDTSHFRK